MISAENVSKIAINFGLSNTAVHGVALAFRIATNNRKLFEPNLKAKLYSFNHKLDYYFNSTKCNVTIGKASEQSVAEETVVFTAVLLFYCSFCLLPLNIIDYSY